MTTTGRVRRCTGPGPWSSAQPHDLPVREVRLAAGAGYVYAICGSLSTMPGLSSHPAAERIDVDLDTGQIMGLR